MTFDFTVDLKDVKSVLLADGWHKDFKALALSDGFTVRIGPSGGTQESEWLVKCEIDGATVFLRLGQIIAYSV